MQLWSYRAGLYLCNVYRLAAKRTKILQQFDLKNLNIQLKSFLIIIMFVVNTRDIGEDVKLVKYCMFPLRSLSLVSHMNASSLQA